MNQKLTNVLLIDDSPSANFLHRVILDDLQCTEKITVCMDGKEALDYLTDINSGDYVRPDLIFLDINMPGMNGWEFLRHYHQLDDDLKGRMLVVMLTSSLNEDDQEMAKELKISDYLNKPLDSEMMLNILKAHFGWVV